MVLGLMEGSENLGTGEVEWISPLLILISYCVTGKKIKKKKNRLYNMRSADHKFAGRFIDHKHFTSFNLNSKTIWFGFVLILKILYHSI